MAHVVAGTAYLPRSPGTHIVGPWVVDTIRLYSDLRTGTQCIGNWASRVSSNEQVSVMR